jgi:dienelactone hydrolase
MKKLFFILYCTAIITYAAPKGWPSETESVNYPTSIDNSQQPMLQFTAKGKEQRPLLVALHTWGGNHKQAGGETVYARWCIENNWHFIHPEFRGPNNRPQACGSEMMVQDILDAVQYMKENHAVDNKRIYLIGVSGGGYASLLMAGRAPEVWAGVSSWAPITDIRTWWEQKNKQKSKYAKDIEKVIGGQPNTDKNAAKECIQRSALTYLHNAKKLNIDINAGISDGHRGGSVPFTHTLYAFNKLVPKKERLAQDLIERFYAAQQLPTELKQAKVDPLYGKKQPIYRKVHGNTRVTIFNGRHEIIHEAALNWLSHQRKGNPAVWAISRKHQIKTNQDQSNSGQ